MPEHPVQKPLPNLYENLENMMTCPECGGPVRTVWQSTKYIYLAHSDENVCVFWKPHRLENGQS